MPPETLLAVVFFVLVLVGYIALDIYGPDDLIKNRRAWVGVSVLLLIAGGICVCLTPGGFFNKLDVWENPDTGVFGIPKIGFVRTNPSSRHLGERMKLGGPGPVIGFLLLAMGGLGIVVGVSKKPD